MRILKIESLPPAKSWVDRDEIMLHSCFQILKDCVEKERVDTHCDCLGHKEFVDEVRFLYGWWADRSKLEWVDDDDQNKEDDTMLLRLMMIRAQLWT